MADPADYATTFALIDADGNGLISALEVKALMTALRGSVSDEAAEKGISDLSAMILQRGSALEDCRSVGLVGDVEFTIANPRNERGPLAFGKGQHWAVAVLGVPDADGLGASLGLYTASAITECAYMPAIFEIRHHCPLHAQRWPPERRTVGADSVSSV